MNLCQKSSSEPKAGLRREDPQNEGLSSKDAVAWIMGAFIANVTAETAPPMGQRSVNLHLHSVRRISLLWGSRSDSRHDLMEGYGNHSDLVVQAPIHSDQLS